MSRDDEDDMAGEREVGAMLSGTNPLTDESARHVRYKENIYFIVTRFWFMSQASTNSYVVYCREMF
jgi:hypothetical protein